MNNPATGTTTMPHRQMSNEDYRKYFKLRTDRGDVFSVRAVDAKQDNKHAREEGFEVICKELPNDNVLVKTPHEAVAISWANMANEVLHMMEKDGVREDKIPVSHFEMMAKAHEIHGLDANIGQHVAPKVIEQVAHFYKKLQEAGKR
ncbi:hypothetical protein E3E12_01225 [Formicincola oecophyllae]|uniref:Uncharacterized protein n=1 Tax=Formicincola oecophyllae TaxID=2558361 RepID=A0A4Y6U6Q1_9PROT|nr:hypothetical protein [Formicincola oecophyllae]QDH13042.1 hypothetical protein E3E12_01225 [Formicincola oecophyllae]